MSLVELSPVESDDGAVAAAYLVTLRRLSSLLLDDAPLESLLESLLELTSRTIISSAAVSVTVLDDQGGYTTAASSSAAAEHIDALQYELREGPCVDALASGRRHHLTDLDEPGRWPAFCARARAHGFSTVLSVPLIAAQAPVGALNIFAQGPEGLTDTDLVLAERIAAPAAATLANARAYRQSVQLARQLQEALESRATIEQAKGVLMARERLSADDAFERMRQISQHRNIKLREVAAALLQHAATRPADPSPPTTPASH